MFYAACSDLSDALEDIVDVPGIEVDTEIDLSDSGAQGLHDRVQRRLDELDMADEHSELL